MNTNAAIAILDTIEMYLDGVVDIRDVGINPAIVNRIIVLLSEANEKDLICYLSDYLDCVSVTTVASLARCTEEKRLHHLSQTDAEVLIDCTNEYLTTFYNLRELNATWVMAEYGAHSVAFLLQNPERESSRLSGEFLTGTNP